MDKFFKRLGGGLLGVPCGLIVGMLAGVFVALFVAAFELVITGSTISGPMQMIICIRITGVVGALVGGCVGSVIAGD